MAQSSVAAERAIANVSPHDRVRLSIDDADRIVLKGNTPPLALSAYETGTVPDDQRLEHLLLVLQSDATQERALEALLEAQQTPQSPLYHHWLTPESYAEHFGVSDGDIDQVKSWLERSGLEIDKVAASRRTLTFSGIAAQIAAAFQTQLRSYEVAGERHIANASDPQIPAALAEVVGGVVSLHNFFTAPQHHAERLVPEYNSQGLHYLTPSDFATIYDVNALYHQAYDGDAETIAVVGRSDILLSDVRRFRSKFGLAAHDPTVIVNGSDPGTATVPDVYEAMLDVEWAGAVASRASISFVTSASTAVSDGVFLSAQYIIDHNLAPVLSMSYGQCEVFLGTAGNSFIRQLWQQAASQGITVLVSSGDSGAAGCDAPVVTQASHGRAINGICSTPYSTCVGGTKFNDLANPLLYWGVGNGNGGGSALGYIPEVAWNESGPAGLWSTGGGASTVYPKPSWQTGPGVPGDGRRDVPDVALSAAIHDGYLVEVFGALYSFSGTSAAAPSFAGLAALVAQKTGARLGNINPELYMLANSTAETAIFRDVTTGNNSVAGAAGYTATAGYDPLTGLGSVDAAQLLAAWGGASAPKPALALALSSNSLPLVIGKSATVLVTTTVSGGFHSPVSLTLDNLPVGLHATFSPSGIRAPGSGGSVLTLLPGGDFIPGNVTLTIVAVGGGLRKTALIAVTVAGVSITAQPNVAVISRGSSAAVKLHFEQEGGFDAALALTVGGLPAGVTATFAPARIAAPGTGTSTLTLTADKSAPLRTGSIVIGASGGSVSQSISIPASVIAARTVAHMGPVKPLPYDQSR